MKILYLANGNKRYRVLKRLLQENKRIIGLVIPKSFKKTMDRNFVMLCKAKDFPCYFINKGYLHALVKKLKPDILLSVGYPYIISPEVLKQVKYPLNIHPTLLPHYKGYHSGYYILSHNESESGVTAHFMSELVDCGDILLQKKIRIGDLDSPAQLQQKIARIEPKIALDAIAMIESGNWSARKQRVIRDNFVYPKRTPDDSEFDPHEKFIDLVSHIRACSSKNYPAFFRYHGQKVYVKLWRKRNKK